MKDRAYYSFAQLFAGLSTAGLCISGIIYHYKLRKRLTIKTCDQEQLTIYEYFYKRIINSRCTPIVVFGISYMSNIYLWSATKALEDHVNGVKDVTKTNFRKQMIFHDVVMGIPFNVFIMGFISYDSEYFVYSLGLGMYVFYTAITGCYSRLMNGILSCAPIKWLQDH